MKKHIVTTFLLTQIACSLYASDLWEMWIDQNVSGEINKNVTAQLGVEQRIYNDIQDFHYFHIEPTLRFRIKKDNYFSLQGLQLWEKSAPGRVVREFEPEFTLNNTIHTHLVDLFSRTQIVYRWQESAESFGCFRFRPGVTIFKKPWLTVYAQNEFLYNYHNLGKFDENRLSMGLRGTIEKHLTWDLYFLHRDNKTSLGANWKGTNVLGVALTLHT